MAIHSFVRSICLCGIAALLASCGTDSRNAAFQQPQPESQGTSAAVSRVDPQMRRVLMAHAALNPKPIESLSPDEARRQPTIQDAVFQVLQETATVAPPRLPPVGLVQLRTIPGPGGAPLSARVYTPAGNGPFPVIVYFHGGGWVIGSIDAYDASCRALTSMTRAVVIAVDYRQAPEFKFPAAPDDCYAAVQYVMGHAEEFAGDRTRVAVAGESAGGNLATVVCLIARDRGGRMPIHQLLIYPITNAAFDTPSYQENADAKPLNAAKMRWFFSHYLANPADEGNRYVSPLRVPSGELHSLPPATIITAQVDPLQSDGAMYAQKLSSAGVPVNYRDFPGMTHEFFGTAAVVDRAKEAQQFATDQLRRAFAAPIAMR